MSDNSKIEWTDATWSPVRVHVRDDAGVIAEAKGYTSLVQIATKMAGHVGQHCEKVSPGCEVCYAESHNRRCLPGGGTGLPYDRRSRDLVEAFVDENALLQPLRWKRGRKIFVENQSDLFGEWVTDEMLDRVFAVMALCPQHTFQVLTKRAERLLAYMETGRGELTRKQCIADAVCYVSDLLAMKAGTYKARVSMDHFQRVFPKEGGVFPNVWLGVTVENQEQADKRIPLLLRTPAAVRFLSCEPLLGPVSLRWCGGAHGLPHPKHLYPRPVQGQIITDEYDGLREIDWVIVGGESGAGARPMHPDWARSLRDQCQIAGVPFFFKQWGEWLPWEPSAEPMWDSQNGRSEDSPALFPVNIADNPPGWDCGLGFDVESQAAFQRVGKHNSGRLLDGRTWDEFPEAA